MLDYYRMFEHACAFADCAKLCEVEPHNFECRFHAHTSAGIVNSAFACEVYLKALLVFHGAKEKELKNEHQLSKLWEKYEKKDKQTVLAIQEDIINWFGSDKGSLFDELLGVVSDNFKEWRYIYEKNECKTHIQFLRGFRIKLREVCCEQFYGKTWGEFINKESKE